jgi:farnesyl-diphosphate farnesyltransferase
MLQGVSRTFALTIPQLPGPLRRQVANAYLLCRIIDTIEDEPALSTTRKHDFCQRFVAIAGGEGDVVRFAEELTPLLSGQTLAAERELIRHTPAVLAITRGFEPEVRQALACCVRIMAEGMVYFQAHDCAHGLRTLADLDRYCYHVAGVVGEMLTRLFCHYSPAIAPHREALMTLAISFGQGLQMTNILKDIWEDRQRGACWLPQECFSALGFDLRDLETGENREPFRRGLTGLIATAHDHLKKALQYTLLIPREEVGIRNFCLWALGMAVLTLRKIDRHRDFTRGEQVKISRRSVKGVVVATRLAVRHDAMLRM